MDVRVGLWRRLSTEELMLLNCDVGEDSWESLGLQGDPTSPFWRRSALGFLWKERCWSWNSSTLTTSCEELIHWRRLCCWEGLEAGGEGEDRGWDGWMASLTWWTWVWVSSGSWWWTGRPGLLWFMGSQRVRHDWATELNWTDGKGLGRMMFSFYVGGAINRCNNFRRQSGAYISFLNMQTQWPRNSTFGLYPIEGERMHRSTQDMQTKDVHWGLFCNSENLETSANEFFKILKLWYIDTNQTIKKSCQDEKKKKKQMLALL